MRIKYVVASAVLAAVCILLGVGSPALAAGSMAPGDPMVKITTMPNDMDLQAVMAEISADVAASTGLPETFVTYYWQFFEGMYCPGCEKAGVREVIFIDLYTPGFLGVEDRRIFMKSLATAIAAHTDYALEDIYLHTHIAAKDQLFIMGDIVTNWKQVGGPDDDAATE